MVERATITMETFAGWGVAKRKLMAGRLGRTQWNPTLGFVGFRWRCTQPTPLALVPDEGQGQAVVGEEVIDVEGAIFGFEQNLVVEVAGGAIAQTLGLGRKAAQ